MPTRIRPLHYLILIIIISGAALIRFQYNIVTWIDTPIRGDATYYVAYANNLIDHHTFSRARNSESPTPDAYWAPGYPLFLAGTILLANTLDQDSYILTLHLQALLGTLTVILVFMLARLAMPTTWALFAAGLMALSPHTISLGSYLLTETLFSFLLTLALLLLGKALARPESRMEISAGLAFAACYMVNPISLLVAPAALLACLLANGNQSRHKATSAVLISALRIMTPVLLIGLAWSIRSAINVPDGAQTSSGRLLGNLIIGLYSDFHNIWRADPRDPSNPATLASARIGSSYALFLQELVALVRDNPAHMLKWYVIDKPLLLWDWNIRTGQGDIFVFPVVFSLYHISKLALATYSVMHVTHSWILLLGLAAFFLVWSERARPQYAMLVVLAAAAYCSAVYIITQAEPRYSVPLRPLLYIAAAYTLSRLALKLTALKNADKSARLEAPQ